MQFIVFEMLYYIEYIFFQISRVLMANRDCLVGSIGIRFHKTNFKLTYFNAPLILETN